MFKKPHRLVYASLPRLAASIAFLATGLATSAPSPAEAADMPVPAPAYYPKLPPAIYDWTGIYVGGHIGGGILTDSVSQNGFSTFNLANTGNLRPAGVIGGAQIGANYEFAPWVVGVEGSWTDSAISGNTLIGCTGSCEFGGTIPIAQERFTSQAQWFAALTGRFGYAANDWLFYAKAGGAWMNVRYTEDLLCAAGPGCSVPSVSGAGVTAATQVLTDNRTGFTVGAGIEIGLVENISAKSSTTSTILAARTTTSPQLPLWP